MTRMMPEMKRIGEKLIFPILFILPFSASSAFHFIWDW